MARILDPIGAYLAQQFLPPVAPRMAGRSPVGTPPTQEDPLTALKGIRPAYQADGSRGEIIPGGVTNRTFNGPSLGGSVFQTFA